MNDSFRSMLQAEIDRIDEAGITKRRERVIEGFSKDAFPKATISGREYGIFNSNDYLGLRHHKEVKAAEHAASEHYGAGPGAVRFISGSLKVHRDLEKSLAKFHGREDAIVYSSAFATNLAVLFCLVNGLTKDSLIDSDVLMISDALNHRSIIDGVRISGLAKDNRLIFEHMDIADLDRLLTEYAGKHKRVVIVTDGVFSMLGEYQHLAQMQAVIDKHQSSYEQGIILVVDDCHGVAACGETGRGVEEIEGVKADLLVGTLGKGFGADGGYVVGDQVLIDYLRESSATYIYSNSISPGTAGAALKAVEIVDSAEGTELLKQSQDNIVYFKELLAQEGIELAAPSDHPIQPVLIGETLKTKALVQAMFDRGYLVTNISYPVVPKGRDEIRAQIAATHTREEIKQFVEDLKAALSTI